MCVCVSLCAHRYYDANLITGIPIGAFAHLTALTRLWVLTRTSRHVFVLVSFLTFCTNGCSSIDSGCCCTDVTTCVVGDDPFMLYVWCMSLWGPRRSHSNQITAIPDGAFDHLSRLTTLWVLMCMSSRVFVSCCFLELFAPTSVKVIVLLCQLVLFADPS
jgi:hypothetical protein